MWLTLEPVVVVALDKMEQVVHLCSTVAQKSSLVTLAVTAQQATRTMRLAVVAVLAVLAATAIAQTKSAVMAVLVTMFLRLSVARHYFSVVVAVVVVASQVVRGMVAAVTAHLFQGRVETEQQTQAVVLGQVWVLSVEILRLRRKVEVE